MQLRLSGQPRIERSDGTAHALAEVDALLLAYLALQGPTARRTLGALLWPESGEAQAASALRQRLFRLRRLLGTEVALGAPLLALAPGVAHDLADAETLLGALALPASPELADWLRRERETRRARTLETLREAARTLEEARDPAAALVPALQLLERDPLSEEAHQRVMRLHYLGGDRAAALAAFEHCEQLLRRELGVRPSAATLALRDTLRQAQAGPAAPRRVLPSSVLRPPRLVGRAAEQRRLRQAWEGALVAAVIGEAGMGKSRLLAELAEASPAVVLAAARPGDAGVPFATIARLLRQLLQRAPGVTPAPGTRAQLGRVLPEFAGAAATPGEAQATPLQQAVLELLRMLPALDGLALDDLHFADPASLELLALLADPASGVRWALAYRPAEAGSALRSLENTLADAALLAPVPVAPLTPEAVAELVDQLGLGIDAAAVAPALHRRTGGNPLFVLETLKQAWVDETLPQLADSLPRPPSIDRLIDRRIGQLSVGALALARVAAIAGVDFDIALAEATLQTPAVLLADALNELEAAQVLKGEQFAHDLVFDAVQRSLPAAIARHLHGSVGDWLAAHGGEPARIAQHYLEAGRDTAAIDWLGRAAARSEQALRLREAMGFLEQRAALEAQRGEAAAAFESALRAARISAGVDHEAASGDARCDRLDALAATPAQAIAAQLWRAHLAELRDAPESAEAALREALQRSVGLGDAALIARCRLRLAASLAIQDRLDEAAEHAEACRAWFDAQGSDDERGELHAVLAQIRDSDGRLEEARVHHAAAAACYERAGRHVKLADAHRDLAANYLFQGDSLHAREHLLQALRGYGQHDEDAAARGPVLGTLGACNTTLGRFDEALQRLAEARELLAVHQPSALLFLALYEASCWRHLGQWQRVHQALRPLDTQDNLPTTVRAGALLQRHHQAKAAGRHDPALLREALALLPDGARTTFRMLIEVEHALDLAPEAGLALLDDVAERATRLGHGGVRLATRVRAAEIAAAVDPARAAHEARAVLEGVAHHAYTGPYIVEPWLAAARAFAAAHDDSAARAALRAGLAWVSQTAQHRVPAEFRAGFLERNPANAALLALAARRGD
ncbi:ATP-binding protein [Piscinibacter defluvii]|uniref:ATP-binding protein n=1 Tax=Piscinibacter defluvii TaxID=1796922 RepID=UPI000FDD6C4E|nr:AAA family ATPase [Piscinibacter defluvii]